MRTSLPHTWRGAATFNERPPGAGIDMLVLHYTGMVTAEASVDRLCDPDIAVSCQYLVDLDGNIIQMVPEKRRANHAGSLGSPSSKTNDYSIGIELVRGLKPFQLQNEPPRHHRVYQHWPKHRYRECRRPNP